MLKTIFASTLSLLACSALAWPTPEVALDEFIAFELNGGRLNSDNYDDYAGKYAHLAEDHEEAGWDSVIVVKNSEVQNLECSADRCTANVLFELHPTADLAGPPYIEHDKGGTETFQYVLENRDGDWRVVAPDDYPRISISTYEQF